MGVNDMYQESLRAFLKPVIHFMDDPSVSEIMINGPEEIWIEAKGKLTLTDAKFTAEGLMGAARNMAQFVGRILNDERPRLDARLPDGSRIHIVIPPIARKGTTISIRKFMQGRPGIEKLIEWGSMTPQMAYLIKAMVHSKLNIIVAGGTGSGKTTLLNIVSTLIPNDERIITIEDSAELQMQQDHIVPFESRPADKFGKGEVNMGHLLHSSLRLRPDRIVVGEVRGGEAFDLMQAMNTGHGGSMATTHANTPTDTLRRLESLCLMSSIDMPLVAIRAQVASAINAIITCERFHDGSRKTTAIAEVLPLDEKGEYRTRNLFVFAPTHKDKENHIHGYHSPTGMLPSFLPMLQSHGFPDIQESFFDPKTYGMPPPPSFMTSNIATHWAPSLKNREKGLPDAEEIQDQISRASEYAEIYERQHKERVEKGDITMGYTFSEVSVKEAKAAAAPKAVAETPQAKAAPQAAPQPVPEPKPAVAATSPSPSSQAVAIARRDSPASRPAQQQVATSQQPRRTISSSGARPVDGVRADGRPMLRSTSNLPPGKRPIGTVRRVRRDED